MDSSTGFSLTKDLAKIDDANNSNDRYNTYLRKVKDIDLIDYAPPKEIEHTESPYGWAQIVKSENLSSGDYLVKMMDYSNQGDSYTFEKYLPYLALAFEYSLMKDFKKSKYFVRQMKDMLLEMEKDKGDFYLRIKDALEHVFVATAANVCILSEDNSTEAEDLKVKCSNLKPLSEMDPIQQSAIHAVKSKFYLSCTEETNLALIHMKEANKLDPQCATWKYWTGKILRKIRRDKRLQDPSEEIPYFEEAVSLDRDAKHLVFLAQAYREKARYLQKNKHSPPATQNVIDSLDQNASDLYIESIELNPTSAAILRRAGNGLMSLPKQFANYRLAKQLLHKAEQYSLNPITFQMLGTFYSRNEPNPDKALEYFQKAICNHMVYGYNEVIRIKYVNDMTYDPLEDLKKAEKALQLSSKLELIVADIGWYYLILKENLQKGLEYFWKIVERNESSPCMKKFYSYSFVVRGPLNMYKVLQELILNTKESQRDETMIKFLDKINNNPHLLETEHDCVSLSKALKEASTTLSWERTKQNKIKQSLDNQDQGRVKQDKTRYHTASTSSRKEQKSDDFTSGYRNNGRQFRASRQENRVNYNEETSGRNKSTSNSSVTGRERRQTSGTNRASQQQENWRSECPKF
ncbi:uncharacterized protein LOC128986964 [Macrosteles quadrilineatus]|uniref:uncharacterized protein LOC128986964 n=1 Tax=Macrosteles quadrilineatus TaxID=74068 RepID=UPI0023E15B99|nr:uncharacterized protein LOC128986964 [Macrosteles quadrilineatus]